MNRLGFWILSSKWWNTDIIHMQTYLDTTIPHTPIHRTWKCWNLYKFSFQWICAFDDFLLVIIEYGFTYNLMPNLTWFIALMFIVIESKKLIDYTIFNVANGTEKVSYCPICFHYEF